MLDGYTEAEQNKGLDKILDDLEELEREQWDLDNVAPDHDEQFGK